MTILLRFAIPTLYLFSKNRQQQNLLSQLKFLCFSSVVHQNNTLLWRFPNGKTTITYPVTTTTEDGRSRVHHALNSAYCTTICKTQGANIKKLIVWFDCPTVPSGMGYVALSRVRKSEDIKFMTPMVADRLTPALTSSNHLSIPSVTRSTWMLHCSCSYWVSFPEPLGCWASEKPSGITGFTPYQ